MALISWVWVPVNIQNEHAYRDGGVQTTDGLVSDRCLIPNLEPGPQPAHFLLELIPSLTII